MSELATHDRPSFAEAFASSDGTAADSQTATPSTETGSTDQPAAAIAQPDPSTTGEGAVAPTSEPGAPPQERWDTILANARTKTAAETRAQVEQEFRQQTAWQQTPEGQQLQQWSQSYQTNPREWFAQTARELIATHPDLAPALRSDAARILAGGRSQPQDTQAQTFEPDIPVYDETGREVNRTYSAQRVNDIVSRAVAEAIQREVSPLRQDFDTRQQRDQVVALQQEAQTKASSEYGRAQTWTGFKEHEPAIAEAFAQHPDWSLQDAYIAVAVPKLQASAQAQTLDSLKTKAAASTVNPSSAVVAATHRPKSLTDKSLKW